MLNSRSSDLLTLPCAALQGAIRNEGDLLELINAAPTRQPRLRSPQWQLSFRHLPR
jgi:hypothetical protein